MNIGFIGLGIMGSHMASRLQTSGYTLVISNRTPEKGHDLLSNGATWATTPAEVGRLSNIVITMLAHPEAVTATALGSDGFLNTLAPDALWIDCSSVHPSFSRKMAEVAATYSVHFIDAPVTGSKQQAAQGELVFLAGGSANDISASSLLLKAMGRKIIHVGENGQGAALKMVINLQLAIAMASFAEGVALGQALGIAPELLLQVLLGGPVTAPFLVGKREKFVSGEYDTEFPLRWMSKDIQLATMSAHEVGVTPELATPVAMLYEAALTDGYGEADFSALYAYLTRHQHIPKQS